MNIPIDHIELSLVVHDSTCKKGIPSLKLNPDRYDVSCERREHGCTCGAEGMKDNSEVKRNSVDRDKSYEWFWHKGLQRYFDSDEVQYMDVDTPGPCYAGWFIKPDVARSIGLPVTVEDCKVEVVE